MKKPIDKNNLKYTLHRLLSGVEPQRSIRRLHASELLKTEPVFCPREHAILDLLEKERPDQFVATCERVTWDLGNMFPNYIIDVLSRERLVQGDWECMNCGRMRRWSRKPKKCKRCESTLFKYHEVRFTSQECGVSSGIDFFYWRDDIQKYRLVEFKTIMKEEFKKLAAPYAEHKQRTSLYLRCIADSDSPHKDEIDTEIAEILYICKGGYRADNTVKLMPNLKDKAYSPFELFTVVRDDKLTNLKWEHAEILKVFRDKPSVKNIPDGVCATQYQKRARGCSVCKECFSPAYNKRK